MDNSSNAKYKPLLRPIFPIVCAYSLGLVLSNMIPYHPSEIKIWCSLFALSCVLSFIASKFDFHRTALILLCCAASAFGGIRMTPFTHEFNYAQQLLISDAVTTTTAQLIEAEVKTAQPNSDGTSGRLILKNVLLRDESNIIRFPGYVRLSWNKHNFPLGGTFLPGDWISFKGNLYRFRGYFRTQDKIANINSYQRQYAMAKAKDKIDITLFADTISSRLESVRRNLISSICKHVEGKEGKLAASMLFNDRSILDRDSHSAFASSGLFHLFAASGLHVAMLVAVFLLVLSPFTFLQKLTPVLIIVMLFLYCWMLNFNTPVVRASVMIAIMFLGNLFSHPTDTFNRLVLAVMLISLVNPLAVFHTGFHLSILCVVSILLLAPVIRLWLTPQETDLEDDQLDSEMIMYLPDSFRKWLRYGLPTNFALVAAVFCLLLPAQLYYFGQCNILSPVANLIGVPLSQLALPATLLTMILSPISETAADYAGSATAFLFMLLDKWASLLGNVSPFIIRTAALPSVLILGIYTFLFSGSYLSYRFSPEYRVKSFAHFLIHFGIMLCVLVFYSVFMQMKDISNLRMWFLDVGQGDATLIVTPNLQTILVDCGPGRPDATNMSILPKMKELGLDKIDIFIVTHPDKDHIGSLESLAREIPVRACLCQESVQPEIKKVLTSNDIAWIGDDSIDLGSEVFLDVMNIEDPQRISSNKNANSLVLQFRWHNFSALLMGDAPMATELEILMNDTRLQRNISLLKVGHHGANSSTGKTFVKITHPNLAIISCGEGNNYGHPHSTVLDILDEYGVSVYRTDKVGTIGISSDGSRMKMLTHPSIR